MIREPLKPHHGYHHWLALVLLLLATALASSAQAYHYPWDQGHDTTDWDDPPPPGPCEGSTCNCSNSTGSPVYVPTGHFIWSDEDLSFPGRPALGLTRTHNSHDPRSGPFGNGWSVGCEQRLQLVGKTLVEASTPLVQFDYVLHAADGKRYVYPSYQMFVGGPSCANCNTPIDIAEPPDGRFETLRRYPTIDDPDYVDLVSPDGSYRRFSPAGLLVAEVDRNGNTLSYEYMAGTNQLLRVSDGNGRSLDFLYNGNGYVSTVTDHAGRSWSYDYDADGNLVAVTNPLGGVRRYDYQAATIGGDGQTYWHLTQVTDEAGVVEVSIAYQSGTGKVASYTMGEERWTYSYDETNRRTTKTDIRGKSRIYRYNDQQIITAVTDRAGYTESYEYNADGRITLRTDQAGKPWRATYDALGRRLTQTDPSGETRQLEYQDGFPVPVRIVSPSGRETTVVLDEHGNPSQITDAANGVTRLGYNAKGDVTAIVDPLGRRTTLAYNAAGLITTISDPLNRVTQASYDARGNRLSLTNAAGETVRWSYDALDRVTGMTDALGRQIAFDYDAAGRLSAVTDARGNVTQYEYDEHGRRTAEVAPDGRRREYAYDDGNRLTQETRADGRVFAYRYDARDLLLSVGAGAKSTSYGYDPRGLLLSATDETGARLSWTYDDEGRQTAESWSPFGEVGYAYNTEDELIGRELKLGGSTVAGSQFAYDPRGWLTRIDGPAGRYDFGLDAAGQRNRLSYPGGQTAYAYDGAGQLSQIAFGAPFNAVYDYGYDDAGRITSWQGDGAADWNYAYDAAGQLTSARHGSEVYAYAYDAAGNRSSDGGVYDEANRLIENDTHRFDYDLDGRQIRKTDKASGAYTRYEYDAFDRLIRVESYAAEDATEPERVIGFSYDPLGRVRTQTEPGTEQRYVYAGVERLALLDAGNNLVRTYEHGPMIDELLGASGDDRWTYFVNHQNSVMAVADDATLSELSYTPYGVTTAQNHANDLRYTGRAQVADDLYEYRARYYDPTVGRFLSEDPVGFEGGWNLYGYAFSNPVMFVDPTGLAPPGLPAGVVNFCAGAGDALLLGFGDDIREGLGIDGGVDTSTGAYEAGSYSSFALGAGRLAYAGAVRGYSIVAPSGAAASAFRSQMRNAFRFGMAPGFRAPNLAQYSSDSALRAAAGRTNAGVNAYGAGVAAAGAAGGCGCSGE